MKILKELVSKEIIFYDLVSKVSGFKIMYT